MFLFLIGRISDSFLRTRHYPYTMYDGGGGGEGGRCLGLSGSVSQGERREDKQSQTEHEGKL